MDSITNIFVPVLNKDTNYFSSIVDTTARELYCYVSLSNTSYYGDSKITAPFGSVLKDIVKLNGGKNSYLAVGTVNIRNLIKNREEQFDNRIKKSKYKPLSAGSNKKIIDDKLVESEVYADYDDKV